VIRRQDTVESRWDYMRTNALDSNPTVAEKQLFTAFDRWVAAAASPKALSAANPGDRRQLFNR